jgi:hypothetical protein
MQSRRRLLLAAIAVACVAATLPAHATARTVRLCKPGLADNPCTPGLDTTRFSPSGRPPGTDRVRHQAAEYVDRARR